MSKNEMIKVIYNWVKENYGESESEEPSWDIEQLAEYIVNNVKE